MLAADAAGVLAGPSLPSHLYLHVPFCRSKCAYCDFGSVAGAGAETVFAVFSGMQAEVRRWASASLPGVIETVYVGGGTPSLHPAQTSSLLSHVFRDLPVRSGAEVTAEANPESLTTTALDALRYGGVNRVSIGVQSFDDAVLRLLGRCHDSKLAAEACARVVDSGLELSLDLICGVPGQTEASWLASLDRAISTGAKHVSVYPLAVEEGTPLAVAVDGGLVPEPDPDVAASMLEIAADVLGEAGLPRYEVANYAAPGHEARHNCAYWTGRSYIGIGPGAHGMLDADTARTIGMLPPDAGDVARVRYGEARDVDAWLAGTSADVELLTLAEALREDVMLGLRLVRGVAVSLVERAGLARVLESLAEDGLVEREGSGETARWRTTRRGWLLGNEVFGRVWSGDE